MRKIFCFFILFALITMIIPVFGARISGAIYDHNLESIPKTVVKINTTPEQTKVSNYGGYLFVVPTGSYEITATLTRNNVTKEIAKEYVNVTSDEDVIKDLFVYDDFDLSTGFEKTSYQKTIEFLQSYIVLIILIIVLIIVVGGILYIRHLVKYRFRTEPKEKQETPAIKNNTPPVTETVSDQTQDDIIANKIVTMLKQHKGMLPQKDIRKEFLISEAKVSLIISELEKKGVVKKQRHGRKNSIHLCE